MANTTNQLSSAGGKGYSGTAQKGSIEKYLPNKPVNRNKPKPKTQGG